MNALVALVALWAAATAAAKLPEVPFSSQQRAGGWSPAAGPAGSACRLCPWAGGVTHRNTNFKWMLLEDVENRRPKRIPFGPWSSEKLPYSLQRGSLNTLYKYNVVSLRDNDIPVSQDSSQAHAVLKRSPLELGLVHGISSTNHEVTHHGTTSHTSSHHNVVLHPPKTPIITGSSPAVTTTSHDRVVHVSSLHDVEGLVTHAVIDPGLHITSTTVITHDKPLVEGAAHPVVTAAVVHPVVTAAVVHPVVTAAVAHPVVTAATAHPVIAEAGHTIVTADHPLIEHHEVTVIPVVVKHDVVPIDHRVVEKTAILLHPHSVTPTHDIFRSHIGGFGVGIEFGGHGAGHGFYASTGFGFR